MRGSFISHRMVWCDSGVDEILETRKNGAFDYKKILLARARYRYDIKSLSIQNYLEYPVRNI